MNRADRARRAARIARRNPRLFLSRIAALRHLLREVPADGIRMRRIGDVAFEFDLGLGEQVKMMYRATYAPNIVWLASSVLGPGDVVIDVGANIGYLAAIFLDIVGTPGRVCAFEPVRRYLPYLKRLAELNPTYHLNVIGSAVGTTPGSARLWVSDIGNIGWNTMVAGNMPPEDIGSVEEVSVVRLDEYLLKHHLRPQLIKIDVEGFEPEVLESLEGYLVETRNPPWLICELTPRAWSHIGRDLDWLATWTSERGYVMMDPIDLSSLHVSASDVTDAVFVHPLSMLSSRAWARRRLKAG